MTKTKKSTPVTSKPALLHFGRHSNLDTTTDVDLEKQSLPDMIANEHRRFRKESLLPLSSLLPRVRCLPPLYRVHPLLLVSSRAGWQSQSSLGSWLDLRMLWICHRYRADRLRSLLPNASCIARSHGPHYGLLACVYFGIGHVAHVLTDRGVKKGLQTRERMTRESCIG